MLIHIDKINLWVTPSNQLYYLTSLILTPNSMIQCHGIHYIVHSNPNTISATSISFVPYQSSIAAKSTFFHSFIPTQKLNPQTQSGLYLVFRKRKWLDMLSANRNNESYRDNVQLQNYKSLP